MLNYLSEKKMHIVRWVLAIAWSILILSLFYDPITPLLTDPSNLISPFRIDPSKPCIQVQNICLSNAPYSMTARIFWAMVVPAGILIIFVFGHEFWRRICPLSFFSQIPRALGIQRQQKIVSPSGTTRYQLFTIEKDSWLGKNHLYLQFGLFFLGLNIRILFVNSDRMALAAFLIFTVLSAVLVGYLFAGKSWCQYFCPMAPVQIVFTGTKGLLGSQAHLGEKLKITQSMCREVDKTTGQEKSACVACQSSCIDIDSERSYWDRIENPDRKLLYFGYIGLVIGFHVYFFLYAGNWEYYYSGAWTHEEGQIAKILSSGFYIFNREIPIPKLIATPLTLAAFCAGTYGIFRIAEKTYRQYLETGEKIGKTLPYNQFLHQIFTICTLIAWNVFWIFGGRSNLAVLPQWAENLFTGFLVIVSGIWFTQTFRRSSEQYNREKLAVTLRRQLAKLGIDMSKILKRNLEELDPNEIYVLAKVLPETSREQKDRVYRGVIVEALEDGVISIAEDNLLKELRQELGIDINQHYAILASLGIADPTLFDSDKIITLEKKLRLDSYQQNLEYLIFDLVETRIPVRKALKQKATRVMALQKEYGITEAEDESIVSSILGEQGILVKKAHLLLSRLEALDADIQSIENLALDRHSSVCGLLKQILEERQRSVIKNLLTILEVLGAIPESLEIARDIARSIDKLSYPLVNELLNKQNNQDEWIERIDPSLVIILQMEAEKILSKRELQSELPFDNEPFISLLKRFIYEDIEPLFKALSLRGIRSLDRNVALQVAEELNLNNIDSQSILAETVNAILNQSHPVENVMSLIIEVEIDKKIERKYKGWHSVFQRSPLLIGSDSSNDIVIPSQSVIPHHATINFNQNEEVIIQSIQSDRAQLYLDNQVINNDGYQIAQGDKIYFSLDEDTYISVNWQTLPDQKISEVENLPTLDKMLYLFESNFFNQIEINSLIELAGRSQMQIYNQSDVICDVGDPSDRLFIILDGCVNAIGKNEDGIEVVINKCFRGESIGELGVLTHSTRIAKLVVASEKTHILALTSRDVDSLLERNSVLARSLLTIVSSRFRKEIYKKSQ